MKVLWQIVHTLIVLETMVVGVQYTALHFREYSGVSGDCASFNAALEFWEDHRAKVTALLFPCWILGFQSIVGMTKLSTRYHMKCPSMCSSLLHRREVSGHN